MCIKKSMKIPKILCVTVSSIEKKNKITYFEVIEK